MAQSTNTPLTCIMGGRVETVGQLLLALECQRVAPKQSDKGLAYGLWDAVRGFQTLPDVQGVQALCGRMYGADLTTQSVLRLRGDLCERQRITASEADCLPLAAALTLFSDGVGERHANLPDAAKGKPKRPRRAPRGERQAKPLTDAQVKSLEAVQDCEGNIAKAARSLGRDRKTVEQHYKEALRKLGRAAVKKPTTRHLPQDQRGQAHVADGDDMRK
ncbi:MAG: hypothetical protein AB7O62_08520 [Pirellulales bacterium]